MKNGLVDRIPLFEMLDHDALQQFRRHSRIPNTFRVYDHNRSITAYAEARRLTALHATRAEEKILSLEERCELRVQLAPPPIGGAEAPDADEHVA